MVSASVSGFRAIQAEKLDSTEIYRSRRSIPLPFHIARKLTNSATLALASGHEFAQPVLVPDDLRRPESDASALPRLNLLHPEVRRCLRVQVGLSADVRLVEAEQGFRKVGVHLLLTLGPLRVVLGTPVAWDEFELAVELGVRSILPVPIPGDETLCDLTAPVVVGSPSETTLSCVCRGWEKRDQRDQRGKEEGEELHGYVDSEPAERRRCIFEEG